MRLISIDTETTGASAPKGDRCVEIGAVELVDGRLTGRTFQTYLNPDRKVAWQAERVHGLTNRFLEDKPRFREIAPDLLDFIGDAPCLAHNARFDRDMILYDFRASQLPIPELRFYDTIPLAKAMVRAPAYRLDVLARTLGVIEQDRGQHGALEDSEILARVLAKIEADQPGALRDWMIRSAPLSPLPKGWGNAAATTRHPRPAPSTHVEADRTGEREEAERIGGLVREAVARMRDFADLADRLTGAGVLMRPVINGDLALHGVRFSTPKASFTGGRIGLTGPALERAGAAYHHPEHEALVTRLIEDHDRVMGSVISLKTRFTAAPPLTEGAAQSETDRKRVSALIRDALSEARNIFDLADRLEPDGVRVETRIDAKRMRVSSVLFVAEGARVPGGRVGLGPRDMSPEFWSLTPHAPLRAGPDGRIIAPEVRKPAPATAPTQIGEGLNEGVAELIAAVNSGQMGIGPDNVSRIRCGRDAWSGMPEEVLWEVITQELPEDQIGARLAELPETDRGSALRWFCRGMDPDRVVAFHETRAALYEARRSRTESDPSAEP